MALQPICAARGTPSGHWHSDASTSFRCNWTLAVSQL